MEQVLSHTPKAVPVQVAAVLEGPENPLDAPAHLVEVVPQRVGSRQDPDDTGLFLRVLPDLRITVPVAAMTRGLEPAAARGAAEEVMAGVRVCFDVVHLLLSDAGGRPFGSVDALMELHVVAGLLDMDYRSDTLLDQEAVISVAVVLFVGHQVLGMQQLVVGLGLGYYVRQHGVIVPVGGCQDEAERDPVLDVSYGVRSVSEAPLDLLSAFRSGAVLEAPAGVHVAGRVAVDGLAAGIPVGGEHRAVDGHSLTEVRQLEADPVRDGVHQLLDHWLDVRETAKEAADGAFTRDLVEAADLPKPGAALESFDEFHVVLDAEDVLAEPGPPEGSDAVAAASGIPVGTVCFESGEQVWVIQAVQNGLQ